MTTSSPSNITAAETPAAGQFAAWLAAFNTGDRSALVAYHQDCFPYDVASEDVAGIDREFGLRKHTGGFVLKKSESRTPSSIVSVLKEKGSDQFARATMEVEATEPHRVIRFEIHPIPTPDEFLALAELQAREIDDAKRRRVIDRIATELEAHYIAADVAGLMVARVRDRLARGDYTEIRRAEAFAEVLTHDLREICSDRHLTVAFRRRLQPPKPSREQCLAWVRANNFGFGSVERRPGNVAHVVIHGFPPLEGDEEREGIANLMSPIADADALLIDLRTNDGGDPATVALVASYVFDEVPVHLNDMFRRDSGVTEQSWTVRDLRGKRFGSEKPVYVLTSRQTFSGGEEFAYDLQALRRATIVGERTGGGAHPATTYDVGDRFQISVPWGRPINPVTKTNWEGAGVVPDIETSASNALEEAHRRALDDVAMRQAQRGGAL